MKKIVILMLMVFGLSAVFADSYVAFTSKEGFEVYCNSDHTELDTWVKEGFEKGTSDFTNQEKKKATLIVVVDDKVNIIYYVSLYAYDSKTFGSIVFDYDFNIIKKCNIYPDIEVDPVLLCSSIISEEVSHIINIDKEKVVFAICEEQ